MTLAREDIYSIVREAVLTLLRQLERAPELKNDESLVLSHRLSSLQIVELAVVLEQQFSLDFASNGFNQYDFDTVDSIVELCCV